MPYLVSVDGKNAPIVRHETVEKAMAEASRLISLQKRNNDYADIRILQEVCYYKVEKQHSLVPHLPRA